MPPTSQQIILAMRWAFPHLNERNIVKMLALTTVDAVRRDASHPHDLPYDDRVLNRLIRHASGVIRCHTRRAVYAVTPAGGPADPDLADAFSDAVLALVESWVAAGLEAEVFTGGSRIEGTVTSSAINGASVTFDHSSAEQARAHLLAGGIPPEVETILRDTGLLSTSVGVVYEW